MLFNSLKANVHHFVGGHNPIMLQFVRRFMMDVRAIVKNIIIQIPRHLTNVSF